MNSSLVWISGRIMNALLVISGGSRNCWWGYHLSLPTILSHFPLPSVPVPPALSLYVLGPWGLYPGLPVKVKRTILHLERWWGAHLPFYGREPVGG